MFNLKNIYKKYLSKKCRILFENNKYSSMHVYANQTSFSAMVLFAKSTQESYEKLKTLNDTEKKLSKVMKNMEKILGSSSPTDRQLSPFGRDESKTFSDVPEVNLSKKVID